MDNTTSPSAGIISPASHTTMSSILGSIDETIISLSFTIFLPVLVVLDFRRLSDWALPLPSAIASAKLANKTVNYSQRIICRLNEE